MRITKMRIVTWLLAFVLLRSDGAGPDPELIVQQVMMKTDLALILPESSSRLGVTWVDTFT